jgi:type IV pilus assembly protein PilA
MIVVAIIGILAAVALPAYQTYTVKAKISEVILAASQCRTTISEVYQTASAAPGIGNWGCEITGTPSKFVASVATDANGVITVTTSGDAALVAAGINAKKVTLVPLGNATTPLTAASVGTIQVWGWRCGKTGDGTDTQMLKYLPGSCRG